MSRRGVAVALLLLLAGCGGTAPVADDPTATETVTPAPVPGEEPRLAPGLIETGVVAPRVLAAAHERTLDRRSYRRVARTLVVLSNGTERVRRNETRLYDPAARRALLVVHDRDPRPNVPTTHRQTWTNGSVTATRTLFGTARAGAEFRVRESGALLGDHGGEAAIEVLAGQSARVIDRREANGTTEFVLRAEPAERSGQLTGVVTAEGVVRSLVFESTRIVDGRAATYRTELRYQPFDGSVGRPDWLDAALGANRPSLAVGGVDVR